MADVVLPCARQQTRGPKYVRKGIWARGDFGLHSTDDPRIFRPGLRRQYPYHKQRNWSPQYMCLQHNSLAPAGHGVKLAIQYRKFLFAQAFYDFQRKLKFHLPGAQILADAQSYDQVPYLKVLRLNDGRTLWEPDEATLKPVAEQIKKKEIDMIRLEGSSSFGTELLKLQGKRQELVEELSSLLAKDLPSIVKMAKDNFECRYGAKEEKHGSRQPGCDAAHAAGGHVAAG